MSVSVSVSVSVCLCECTSMHVRSVLGRMCVCVSLLCLGMFYMHVMCGHEHIC